MSSGPGALPGVTTPFAKRIPTRRAAEENGAGGKPAEVRVLDPKIPTADAESCASDGTEAPSRSKRTGGTADAPEVGSTGCSGD